MEKVQKPSNSEYDTPSSEPFRIYKLFHVECQTYNAVTQFFKLTGKLNLNIPVNTRGYFTLTDFLSIL
jgi:hypothetical protein